MPKYSLEALREQRVTVEFEAPDLETAKSYVDDRELMQSKIQGTVTVEVEETLPELYGIDVEETLIECRD